MGSQKAVKLKAQRGSRTAYVPPVAFDVTQMQETQAKPPSLAGIGQTDKQIGDLFILGAQLRNPPVGAV